MIVNNNNNVAHSQDFLNAKLLIVKNEKISARRMYYMWIARLFIIVAIFMLVGNILFSLSILQIVPQIEVDPLFLLNFTASEDLARIEHANPNISSKEIVRETFIRLFVSSLNTVVSDVGEMARLLSTGGIIYFLTEPQLYSKFHKDLKEIETFLQQNKNREVKITNVQRIGKSAVWRVDFRTYEMQDRSDQPKIRYWTASISCVLRKDRRLFSRVLINPLGFTVVRYSQAEVEL